MVKRTRFGPGLAAKYLSHFDLQTVCEPRLQPGATPEGFSQRRGDHFRVVPEDVGEVALPVIEDLVPVLIVDIRALRGV